MRDVMREDLYDDDDYLTMCDIVDGCEDCPRYMDDCDGDPDKMIEGEDDEIS